ncbi:XRE family transcriptional regulator, partial [Lactobacillus sp. XV13L]|nr:XRE family transcriptional regulator [Lactobacillus sp. XV13L]
MKKAGTQFKNIRQAQGITLREAASDICSIQMLSRWENNSGHMDFQRAVKLFERINLTAEEYINLADLDFRDGIALRLEAAWEDKDTASMQQLAKE